MRLPERGRRGHQRRTGPSLSAQIMTALQRALRDDKLDAAEHLLCALEQLADEAGEDGPGDCCRVTRDQGYLAVADMFVSKASLEEVGRLPSHRLRKEN